MLQVVPLIFELVIVQDPILYPQTECIVYSFYFIKLTANCGHPSELLSAVNLSVLNIEDYNGLPIEGSTIMFRCPTGLELIGDPTSAICAKNGVWEPSDFTGLMCTDSSGKEFRISS